MKDKTIIMKEHYEFTFISGLQRKITLSIIFFFILVSSTFGNNVNLQEIERNPFKDCFTIIVKYKEAQVGDTLTLVLSNPAFKMVSNTFNKDCFNSIEKDGMFTFHIPVSSKFGYFDIIKSRTFTDDGEPVNKMSMIHTQFWEVGDSVTIDLSHKETYTGINSKCRFKGKGAEKYIARYLIDSIQRVAPEFKDSIPLFDNEFNYHNNYAGLIKERMSILTKYRSILSEISYQALEADIFFYNANAGGQFYYINVFYRNNVANAPNYVKAKFARKYENYFDHINTYNIDPKILAISKNYLFFLNYKFEMDAIVLQNGKDAFNGGYDIDWIFQRIVNTTSGLIRERELIIYFIEQRKSNNESDLLKESKKYIHDKTCLKMLYQFEANSTGEKIWDGSFCNTRGENVKLSDFKNKIVLIDFWFNGCGVCSWLYTTVLFKLEKKYGTNKDIVFLSVNIDRTKERWIAGIKSGKYTDDNVMNVNSNMMGMDDPFIQKAGVSYTPYLILLNRNMVIEAVNSNQLYDYDKADKFIRNALEGKNRKLDVL